MAYNSSSEKYRNHYIFQLKGFGSSSELKGNVQVTVVFLENIFFKWNILNRSDFKKKVKKAMSVLEHDAASNNIFLNININYESCDVIHSSVQTRSWLVDFLAKKGYKSISEYQAEIKRKYNCNEAPVIFVWNCPLLAFAVSADEHSPNNDEFSVLCYHDSVDTINHELLHQFGAMDLYLPPDAIVSAKKHLSNTIMIDGSFIDPLTQYLIGWRKDLSKEALTFLEETKHYTTGDCISAKIERVKNPKNTAGIPTDENGNKIIPFTSFNDLREKANQGHTMACFLLAYCYGYGIIVAKNQEESLKLYKKILKNYLHYPLQTILMQKFR